MKSILTLTLAGFLALIMATCAGTKVEPPIQVPALIQVVPAEVLIQPGDTVQFTVRAFDENRRILPEVSAQWSFHEISGTVDRHGNFFPDESTDAQAGTVTAQVGSLQSSARVRIVPGLPWSEDFESLELETYPSHWVGATNKFFVRLRDGNRVLVKPPVQRGLNRSNVYLGLATMQHYTIQADLMGTKEGRNLPDMGLIANRYTLDLMGNHQRLQIRSWAADLRMAKTIDFSWEPDVWYTMKMTVDFLDGKSTIKGKVWETRNSEPDSWTITAEDPLPNREGSPGLYGYSASAIYYDNLKVW